MSTLDGLWIGERPMRLERFDYASIKKAHDVRKLGECRCGGLLSKFMALDVHGEWFHGRCFVAVYGEGALYVLPTDKTDRLTLEDIGVDVMRRLIEHRSE